MRKKTNIHVDRGAGRRIHDRRLELGLSQRSLASPGVSYAYISRIEAGTRTPSLSALMHLAERLDTTALYLMTGKTDGTGCPFCRGTHTDDDGRLNGNG